MLDSRVLNTVYYCASYVFFTLCSEHVKSEQTIPVFQAFHTGRAHVPRRAALPGRIESFDEEEESPGRELVHTCEVIRLQGK